MNRKTAATTLLSCALVLGVVSPAHADPPAAPPSTVKADAPAPRSNLPAFLALGVAGAGVAIGTIYGVTAIGARSDFDAHPSAANADKADGAALVADVAFGVAFASGVTALVLLLSNSDVPARKTAFVTPVVGPSGGGVAGGLKF